MVKVVNSFKGKTTEELQKLPNEELFALLNARQRRSLKRGLSDNKKKLIAEIKEMKEGKNKNPINYSWSLLFISILLFLSHLLVSYHLSNSN